MHLHVKHLMLPPSRQVGWILEITRSRANIFLGDGYVLHDIELADLTLSNRVLATVRPYVLEAIARIQKLKNKYYSILRPQRVPDCIERQIKRLEEDVDNLTFTKFRHFTFTLLDLEELLERNRGLEKELKIMTEKYDTHGSTIKKLNDTIITQKTELINTRRDLQTISDDHTRMKLANVELQAVQSKTMHNYESSGKKNEFMKQDIRRLERLWKESKNNNTKLLQSNETLRENLSNSTRDVFDLQNEVNTLKMKFKLTDSQAHERTKLAFSMERDRNTLMGMIDKFEQQNDKLLRKVHVWEERSFQDTMHFLKNLYSIEE